MKDETKTKNCGREQFLKEKTVNRNKKSNTFAYYWVLQRPFSFFIIQWHVFHITNQNTKIRDRFFSSFYIYILLLRVVVCIVISICDFKIYSDIVDKYSQAWKMNFSSSSCGMHCDAFSSRFRHFFRRHWTVCCYCVHQLFGWSV